MTSASNNCSFRGTVPVKCALEFDSVSPIPVLCFSNSTMAFRSFNNGNAIFFLLVYFYCGAVCFFFSFSNRPKVRAAVRKEIVHRRFELFFGVMHFLQWWWQPLLRFCTGISSTLGIVIDIGKMYNEIREIDTIWARIEMRQRRLFARGNVASDH